MFLDFYGMREQPFGVTPDPAFLYASSMHREALASLIYSIESHVGFAALVGEAGTGKTTLLFSLLERYRECAHTALVLPVSGSADDLLRCMMAEFALDTSAQDPVIRHEQFQAFLLGAARDRKPVIVILDEAQNLSDAALEGVRMLSNFETSRSKLLDIILAGQPALAERLRSPLFTQLQQRITIVGQLGTLNSDDVIHYVDHRLTTAGYTGPELFTKEALEQIVTQSGGIPRNINAICFNALSIGCALRRRTLGADILKEVAKDRDLFNSRTFAAAEGGSDKTDAGSMPSGDWTAIGSRSRQWHDSDTKRRFPSSGSVPNPAFTAAASSGALAASPGSAQHRTVAPEVEDRTERQLHNVTQARERGTVASETRNQNTRTEYPAAPRNRSRAEQFSDRRFVAQARPGIWKMHRLGWTLVSCLFLVIAAGAVFVLRYWSSPGQAPPHVPTAQNITAGGVGISGSAGSARKIGATDRRSQSTRKSQELSSNIPEARPVAMGESALDRSALAENVPPPSLAVDSNLVPATSPLPVAPTQTPIFRKPRVVQFNPVGPRILRRSRIPVLIRQDGRVVLEVTIGADGKLTRVSVQSGPRTLAAVAEQAVREWQFAPASLNGMPVEGTMQITITFSRH